MRTAETALLGSEVHEIAELLSRLHPRWLNIVNLPTGTIWLKENGDMSLEALVDSVKAHFDSQAKKNSKLTDEREANDSDNKIRDYHSKQ